MPPTSAKNDPLSPAGVDLGLTGNTPGHDEETEEEKRKRLEQAQKLYGQQSGVMMDLGLA